MQVENTADNMKNKIRAYILDRNSVILGKEQVERGMQFAPVI